MGYRYKLSDAAFGKMLEVLTERGVYVASYSSAYTSFAEGALILKVVLSSVVQNPEGFSMHLSSTLDKQLRKLPDCEYMPDIICSVYPSIDKICSYPGDTVLHCSDEQAPSLELILEQSYSDSE